MATKLAYLKRRNQVSDQFIVSIPLDTPEIMINCMSRDVLERTNSYNLDRIGSPKHHTRLCFLKVERTWSGDLTRETYEQVTVQKDEEAVTKVKKNGHHRRYMSEAGALLGADREPKLVRSSGMRRDWSFEDLRNKIRTVGQ